MKIFALLITSVSLLFLVGGSKSPQYRTLDPKNLDGNISITLKHGLWKLWEDKPIYQDITIDLICHQGQCEPEAWAFAPKFNQDLDHQGTVQITQTDTAWQLKVKLNVQSHPGNPELQPANYTIELVPFDNKLIGSYVGKYQDRFLANRVQGEISPIQSRKLPHHQPIQPREHPRLIFRAEQLPQLKAKAKTADGQKIINRLENALKQEIYYDGYVPNGGYHAAGYCFLSLLKDDPQAAETAWQIVEKSLQHPGERLLEQSPIVAGVALAYDLCYPVWNEQRQQKITQWLTNQAIKLINGDSPKNGWNNKSWSNWNARARGASGLAALAIMYEPETYYPKNKYFSKPEDAWRLMKISERNISRYLELAIGDRAFGTEGDHYTTEPWILTIIPFLQAYRNTLGVELAPEKTQWFLPLYITRLLELDGKLAVPTYGRHHLSPDGTLFAMGLPLASEKFLPGVIWFFDRYFSSQGDSSFGINEDFPQEAIYALVGYRDDLEPQNPADIWGKVLVDKQKGLYAFRNQWQDEQDFIASIYLQTQPLSSSWYFPDEGSFRIWGLGNKWADVDSEAGGKREDENVVVVPTKTQRGTQLLFSQTNSDGSGVVSFTQNNWLRSFGVDYGGLSGAPGLFAVVDRYNTEKQADFPRKTWTMHTKGQVTINGQTFTITSPTGATMQGTFVSPKGIELSSQAGIIRAVGSDNFFVVMSVQQKLAPKVTIDGSGLEAKVTIGKQTISFQDNQLVFKPK
jgi:hypothetical protein